VVMYIKLGVMFLFLFHTAPVVINAVVGEQFMGSQLESKCSLCAQALLLIPVLNSLHIFTSSFLNTLPTPVYP
jgi:hypothetical protein